MAFHVPCLWSGTCHRAICGLMNPLVLLIVIAALFTLGVLLTGVFTMARGKDVTGEKSNKLMRLRVIAQAATLVLIIIFVAIAAGD